MPTDDREWLAPEALVVLDGDTAREGLGLTVVPDWYAWTAAGRPLLSARARAIKEAVEEGLQHDCVHCSDSQHRCCDSGEDDCAFARVRRAYLSGAKPEPIKEEAVADARSFCVNCGPDTRVDEDGCCLSCGADALGEWATKAADAVKPPCEHLDEQRGRKPEPTGQEEPMSDTRSFCVQCGPDVRVDEDGCCLSCGADALGEWSTRAADAVAPKSPPAPERTCGDFAPFEKTTDPAVMGLTREEFERTGRVKCPHSHYGDPEDCTLPAGEDCPAGHIIDLHGDCTIPCDCKKVTP